MAVFSSPCPAAKAAKPTIILAKLPFSRDRPIKALWRRGGYAGYAAEAA